MRLSVRAAFRLVCPPKTATFSIGRHPLGLAVFVLAWRSIVGEAPIPRAVLAKGLAKRYYIQGFPK